VEEAPQIQGAGTNDYIEGGVGMTQSTRTAPADAGRETSVPYNATVDLLERNLAAGRAERPYLITDDRTWTYREVGEAADAAGAGLLDLGFTPGDRVILALNDSPELVVTFWGAMKAGLVPIPVAGGLSTADLHFIFMDSAARAVVCDAGSAGAVLPAASRAGIHALFAGDPVPEGARSWHEVCARPRSMEAAPTTEDDIALWLYTSGTTGLPKAAMHRHSHLKAAPDGLARQVIGMNPDDLILSASRMFFAYGLGNSVYLPAAAGASVAINPGPVVPARILELLNRVRPTVFFGVPTVFDGLTRLDSGDLPDSIRVVISAGEALSPQLFERFRARFGLPLLDGLGATEALHHVTSNRLDDVVPGSAGRPLAGWEVQILDRDGDPVGDGDSGELWVRGPATFAGYWKRPELTARARRGGWMRTGDLVRMVDGRLYHEGRLDDLIKLGGVWVAPIEIEDVLRNHPDVMEAAVVAVDEGTGVPLLKAFVTSARQETGLESELKKMCRERLARFKVPHSYEIVERLPRTQTGKLQRFVLRGSDSNGKKTREE
jgi:benzoate-CoA ligase family protein